MKATYFNRHKSMNAETRSEILDLISDLEIIENCNQGSTLNMLYAAFDGYDYSPALKADPLIQNLVIGGNDHLTKRILEVAKTISKYPRTSEPNHNQF